MNYSRWATKDELVQKLIKINDIEDIKQSGLPVMYDDDSVYIDKSSSHSLVIGSTGSGKTQSVILPLLKLSMFAGESVIITDPNMEIYKKTADKMKKENYKVYALNFQDPRFGNSWNPLEIPYKFYKENNKDKAIEMVEQIAYYLLGEKDNQNIDPFWTNSAINYFTGLVLYLFENAQADEINLNSVEYIANQINDNNLSKLFLEKLNSESLVYLKLVGILKTPPETRGSIFSVFHQKIEKFISKENLTDMLSNSDFDLETINNEKVAIYLINGISSCSNQLVPLFINQIVEIYNKKRYLNILLDEFDNMVPIKDFAKVINYCRNLYIKITVTVQSYVHLSNMYSKEELEILKMCFGNIIYLLSQDIYTLEEISKYCGEKVENNQLVPLITIDELKTLDYFEAIMLMTRTMPIRTKLLPDYKIDWKYEELETEMPKRENKEIKIYRFK